MAKDGTAGHDLMDYDIWGKKKNFVKRDTCSAQLPEKTGGTRTKGGKVVRGLQEGGRTGWMDGGNRMFAMGKGVASILVYFNAVRTHIVTRRIQKENSIIQDLSSKAFCTFAPFQIIRECPAPLITARTVRTTIAKRREIQKGSPHYGTLSTALRLQDVTLGSDIHAKGLHN